MIQTYRTFFKDIQACALNTAIGSFILYLFAFLGICYGFGWMPDDDSFNFLFEKYLVLSIAIVMFILFGIVAVLIFSTIHGQQKCLLITTKIYIGVSTTFTLVTLAAGIYIIIEGTLYIGAIVVAYSLILQVLHTHIIIVNFALNSKLLEDALENSSPRSSDSTS